MHASENTRRASRGSRVYLARESAHFTLGFDISVQKRRRRSGGMFCLFRFAEVPMWCGDVRLSACLCLSQSVSVCVCLSQSVCLSICLPACLPACVYCGVVWCRVVSCGVVWCRVLSCGVVWCGVVWCGVVRCGADVVRCGVVWCCVVLCGVVRCCVVLCGAVRCGAVWCVLFCFVLFCFVLFCFCFVAISAEPDFESPRAVSRSGVLQEMILVVHFLILKQEAHKWHHVCASRVCSLFCEMKDRLQGKQNISDLLSSRVGMPLMSSATARRPVHAAMDVINEVLDLVSPLNSSSPENNQDDDNLINTVED